MATSAGTVSVGLVIYQYLSSMTVADLDLTAPVYEDILCLDSWPLTYASSETAGWLDQGAWHDWTTTLLNQKTYQDDHQCQWGRDKGDGTVAQEDARGGLGPRGKSGFTCSNLNLPISGVSRPLGLALGPDSTPNDEVLSTFAYVFLWLGIALCYVILWHDLSMCSARLKDNVLDLHGVYKHFYWLVWFLTRPSGLKIMRLFRTGELLGVPGKVIFWVLMPVFIVWAMSYFAFVWWPFAALTALIFPVRLARVAVFMNSVLFFMWALGATILSLVMLGGVHHRPQYAVTFEVTAEDPTDSTTVSCYCGCQYRMSQSKNWELLVVSFGATIACLIRAWGCLKGLRNSNWATLMTVKFPVPLNVYPVVWTREDNNGEYIDGDPILHRDKFTPVQGEVAFDPFALMDEQVDCATTWCNIRPSKVGTREKFFKAPAEESTPTIINAQSETRSQKARRLNHMLSGPLASPEGKDWQKKCVKDQDLCCGFACVKFGAKPVDSDDEETGTAGEQVN